MEEVKVPTPTRMLSDAELIERLQALTAKTRELEAAMRTIAVLTDGLRGISPAPDDTPEDNGNWRVYMKNLAVLSKLHGEVSIGTLQHARDLYGNLLLVQQAQEAPPESQN